MKRIHVGEEHNRHYLCQEDENDEKDVHDEVFEGKFLLVDHMHVEEDCEGTAQGIDDHLADTIRVEAEKKYSGEHGQIYVRMRLIVDIRHERGTDSDCALEV